MFIDTPRTWIPYDPVDHDNSLPLGRTSSLITFILSISLLLVLSYSSNGIYLPYENNVEQE